MAEFSAELSNVITVSNPTNEFKAWCENELTLANPEFIKKQRMGKWTGNTPKEIKLYYTVGDNYVVPYGCLSDVAAFKPKLTAKFTNNPVTYGGTDVPLYDYQVVAVDKMLQKRYGILQSKAGSGKGLPLNAIVYTPKGAKRNGDLQIGDDVCNTYGGVSKVTGIYDKGVVDCYKVTFSDGNKIICDKDHLWTVNYCRRYHKEGKRWVTKNIEELYNYGVTNESGEYNFEIPMSEPVFFENKNVTVDPWLLGAYLGDGSSHNRAIYFSNTEIDVIEQFSKLAPLVYKGGCDYYVKDGGRLCKQLEELNILGMRSYEKFIPKNYLYNDTSVRLKVLQGLIDTDGSITNTTIEYSTTSKQLADDVKFLVESLGGTCKIAESQTHYTYKGERKVGRKSYRLRIKIDQVCFSSEKHKSRYTPRTKYTVYRRIVDIKKVEPQITRCITVDSDNHLYLTDYFIATHNTQMGVALAKKLGRRTLWLTHTLDLLKQSRQRAEKYIDKSRIGTVGDGKVEIGECITFATVQTMSKIDLTLFRDIFDVIIVDECHRCCSTAHDVSMFGKVLNNLAAQFKFGLSATVHRADGMIKGCFALLGDVQYVVPDEAIADKVMDVTVVPVYTDTKLTSDMLNTDGTMNWNSVIAGLTTDEDRCRLIVSLIEDNHSTLVLSSRTGHLEKLMSMLPDDMLERSAYINGKMTSKKAKAERENAIEEMRGGKKNVLFATYQLAKEGLDIPRLDRLVMATPEKDYAVIVQSVGRIARTFDGKDNPIAYDIVDGKSKTLMSKFKARCRIYKKEKIKVEE